MPLPYIPIIRPFIESVTSFYFNVANSVYLLYYCVMKLTAVKAFFRFKDLIKLSEENRYKTLDSG